MSPAQSGEVRPQLVALASFCRKTRKLLLRRDLTTSRLLRSQAGVAGGLRNPVPQEDSGAITVPSMKERFRLEPTTAT
jgi:hypothetical protein